ncbi:hypothetical protein LJR029_000910 [Caballeronia sp. LjRoot29]|uniref:hypothetical protein n=1 Tax=Caballeronia sp. LjRoot29 TaxID=3342315 RepID=UPI003ECC98FC
MKTTAVILMLAVFAGTYGTAKAVDAPAPASNTAPTLGAPVPASLQRGNQADINGENLPLGVAAVQLCADIDPGCIKPYSIGTQQSTSKSIKFFLPDKLKPGTYRARISADQKTYLYTTPPLVVTRITPAISALSETTLYPAGFLAPDYADIQIQGTGFAGDAETVTLDAKDKHGKPIIDGKVSYKEVNQILINGVPLRQCDPPTTRFCTKVDPIKEGNLTSITVSGIPRSLTGKVKIAVQVEDAISNSQDLLLSRSPRYAPRFAATALLLIVVALAWRAGCKTVDVPLLSPTARLPSWKTIFIDGDSKTYSLSRLQLVIWTFVALFGWIYLSVARSLIQGMVTFSDIPSGLPGVLVVAVGTSVAATGVQAMKGTKSSGPFSPTFSDFYSVGGVIAPERAQYFLWTIVGAIGFIVYTLALDPATIQDLPKLPDGFLQLAGISAAGYIGGKAVRKGGPVLAGVKGVSDQAVTADVTWTLTGTGLAKNATFAYKVGSGDTEPAQQSLPDATVEANSTDQDGDPTLFKKLTVTMKNTPPAALPSAVGTPPPAPKSQYHKRLFVIINPDGQQAEWPY